MTMLYQLSYEAYFRNIKIQLDSEAQTTKTIETNYNEVKDD